MGRDGLSALPRATVIPTWMALRVRPRGLSSAVLSPLNLSLRRLKLPLQNSNAYRTSRRFVLNPLDMQISIIECNRLSIGGTALATRWRHFLFALSVSVLQTKVFPLPTS